MLWDYFNGNKFKKPSIHPGTHPVMMPGTLAGWCSPYRELHLFLDSQLDLNMHCKPGTFPPSHLGCLERTAMDPKLFWINRKSSFLLQSSSWNSPRLFFTKEHMLKGAKCSTTCPGTCQWYAWLWWLGRFCELASEAGRKLCRQLQTRCYCRRFYYSCCHPPCQEGQRVQG